MDLDRVAERANAGGHTAQGKRRLILGGIGDGIAGFGRWLWSLVRGFFGAIGSALDFLIRNLRIEGALAAGGAIMAFETTRAKDGWDRLMPDDTALVFLWIGAAGVVFGGAVCVRGALEAWREPIDEKNPDAGRKEQNNPSFYFWLIGVVFCAVLSFMGVLGSVGTDSVERNRAAEESRRELQAMVDERDKLEVKLDVANTAFFEAEIFEQNRYLESLESTARGAYQMKGLSLEDCEADLSLGARRLCNMANGGIDVHTAEKHEGIRNVITRVEQSLERARLDEARLAELEPLIKGFVVKGGDEVHAFFADLADEGSAGRWLALFYAVFSAGLIYVSWLLVDWALEEIEKKRAAAKSKKKEGAAA